MIVDFNGHLVSLSRHYLSVNNKRAVASRRQFLLHLCMAMTAHKTQRLEFDSMVADAKKFRQPVMFAAISRVKCLEDLCVLNFSPEVCPAPQVAVKNFINTPSNPAPDDMVCCDYPSVQVSPPVYEAFKPQALKQSSNHLTQKTPQGPVHHFKSPTPSLHPLNVVWERHGSGALSRTS